MKFKNNYLNKKLNYLRYLLKPQYINPNQETKNIEEADKIILKDEVQEYLKSFKIGLVKDTDLKPYYTKFKRFLDNNKLDYQYYNIFSSDWLEKSNELDIIIWRPMSNYWEIQDARDKIYFIEKELKKVIIPSFKDIKLYENKAMQYYYLKNYNHPVINTFISADYNESLNFIENTKYPIVSKIKNSSGASDVTRINNKFTARRTVNKIFKTGKITYWPFLKQKNYVIFQEYIENYGYDLRIIIVDKNHIFGYFRYPKNNDFRASGSGFNIKKKLPIKAVEIAYNVFKDLDINLLAVDFLKSTKDENYYISELSYYTDVITCTQGKLEGTPGRYIYKEKDYSLEFKEGKYWLQELLLKKVFTNLYISAGKSDYNE